jgi:hypothetical protein
MDRDQLNPAQCEVVDDLMQLGVERPTFRPQLRAELRDLLESSLADLVRPPGIGERTWVNKSALAQVLACEAYYASEAGSGFPGWNRKTARGSVVHKALELSVSMRDMVPPLVLVDHALDSLQADDRSLSTWLVNANPLEIAELRAAANDTVAKFFECWPPLLRAWSPRSETQIGVDLCDQSIRLTAKTDLVLGIAAGMEARALVVDLKTADPYPAHVDDLRFYALVHTLRLGVPPFRVASYYLDTASFHAEDVNEELLFAAARRVTDGVRKIAELERGVRAATITEGQQCRWCELRVSCDGASRWAAAHGLDDPRDEHD